MNDFFAEMKRRNVFRVGVAYLALAWVVIEVTGMAVPALNLPDSLNSIVFYLGLIGFPFALFFAWAFELTPDGLKRSHEVTSEDSVTHETAQKLEHLVVVLLVIAVGFFAWDKFGAGPGPEVAPTAASPEPIADVEKSIAVLPFVNMSSDAEQEYFSDGITEDILNALVAVDGLSVVGRTSSFAFKGKNQDLREIGAALGVDHLVEGSVRKAGLTVRITAQLILADTGRHLWSETYDREITDIFAVQDEISAAIADALQLTLLGRETTQPAGPIDATAYDLYLRALQNRNINTFASLAEAVDQLERVKKIAPDFLEARALLAELRASQAQTGSLPERQALRLAEAEAQAVLAIDPAFADAHATLGYIAWMRRDLPAARRHLDAARDHGANALTIGFNLMNLRRAEGDTANVQQVIDGLLRLDPLNPGVHWQVGMEYYGVGDYSRARSSLERSLELRPGNATVWSFLGTILSEGSGDVRGAVDSHVRAFELDPIDPDLAAGLAEAYLDIGMLDAAQAALEEAQLLDPSRGYTHVMQAKLRRDAGDRAAALALAIRSLDDPATNHRWDSDEELTWLAASVHMEQGDFAAAEARLLKTAPALADLVRRPPTTTAPERFIETAILRQIYRETDRAAEAAALAAPMALYEDRFRRPRQAPFARAAVILAGGDQGAALDRLEAIYAGGFVADWRVYYRSAAFFELWDHPRHQALIARIEADMDAQRAALVADRTATGAAE